jgi:glycosyltransferase involved in cell wall biosynthesis
VNIYYGIPSGSQINFEEIEISHRLITALSALPCYTRDFSPDDPYPFEAVKGTPSLIHAFNLTKAGIQCAKLADKSRIPLVISCSGLEIFAEVQNSLIRSQLQETLEQANHVIVPFSGMAKFLKARLQVNTRFEVIAPGLLPIENDFDFPREHFDFAPADRIVLLEGGLIPAKNALFAIHTIEKLIKDYPDLRLVIFDNPSDPATRDKVENEAASKPWIKILQRPEPELIPFVFKMAEVILNVSHAEGYNPFLLKAMQLARPVLAADIQGNSHYLRNETNFPKGGTGLLYSTSPGPSGFKRIHDVDDFIDRLRFLLDNPDEAKEIGKRAAGTVKKAFSLEKELYMHLQIYKNILK